MTTPPLDLPALREYAKELERDGARSGTIRTDLLRALLDRVENTESERDHWDKMARRALIRAELAEARAEDAEAAARDLAAVTVSRDGWQTRAEAAEKKVAAAEALHPREVIAVHESHGVEAMCTRCQTRWPCMTITTLGGTR